MKLSVLIPVYNEARTIDEILRLVAARADREGDRRRGRRLDRRHARDPRETGTGGTACASSSTRATWARAARSRPRSAQAARRDPAHPGRGPRVRPGRVPDVCLKPIEAGRADVVFGSRFRRELRAPRPESSGTPSGNRLLTLISNVFTNLNLTDMATCYKAFHRRVVPSLDLESKRFGVDAEFTVKVARGGFRIFEVPVSYFGRSRAEGKKIRLKDGFSALAALVRHRFGPRPKR